MAVIELDGLRLGTSEDAGRICVTKDSEHGVAGDMYRYFVRELRAPGPYQWRNPVTDQMTSARDEEGRELFDLDAVAAWHASRPGPGWFRGREAQPGRWSALRWDLITGARDGLLRLDRTGDHGRSPLSRSYLGDEELLHRKLQRLGELVDAGLITRPDGDLGNYAITDAGLRWLEDPNVLKQRERGERVKAPSRGTERGKSLRWNAPRWDLVTGARDGRLNLNRAGRSYLGDVELRPVTLRSLGELVKAGLVRPPRGAYGRYRVTAAGRRWLEKNAAAQAQHVTKEHAEQTGDANGSDADPDGADKPDNEHTRT